MARRDMSALTNFNDDLDDLRSGDGLDGIIQRRASDQIVVGTEAELSPDEQIELEECEATIDRGIRAFFEAGQALARVRDLRLYRANHPTFEAYCQQRWGMERRHAYRLVDAAAVFENVSHGTHTHVPTNERQARPLTRLQPDQQREAWEQAVLTAPNGQITAAHVERTVAHLYPPPDPAPATRAPASQSIAALIRQRSQQRGLALRLASEQPGSPLAAHVRDLVATLDEIAEILGIDT